jgi:hypothetical protein
MAGGFSSQQWIFAVFKVPLIQADDVELPPKRYL